MPVNPETSVSTIRRAQFGPAFQSGRRRPGSASSGGSGGIGRIGRIWWCRQRVTHALPYSHTPSHAHLLISHKAAWETQATDRNDATLMLAYFGHRSCVNVTLSYKYPQVSRAKRYFHTLWGLRGGRVSRHTLALS
jgi:hypothetical protein